MPLNKFLPVLLFCFETLATQAQTLSYTHHLCLDQTLLYEDISQAGHYYYVPDTAQITLDATGAPQISNNRFIMDERAFNPGAIFQVMLNFAFSQEKLKALEYQLQQKQPGAHIVGAVPFQLSQGISPTFSHEQHSSFEFFPPAAGVLQIALPKSGALLAQSKGFSFESVLNGFYSVSFEGYVEVPSHLMQFLLSADSSTQLLSLLQSYLSNKTLSLYSKNGQEIPVFDREIQVFAVFLTQQLLNQAINPANLEKGKNYRIEIAGAKLEFPLGYHVRSTLPATEAFKKSQVNLSKDGFDFRSIRILKDFDFEDILPNVNAYRADLQLIAGPLGQRKVLIVDDLIEEIGPSRQGLSLEYTRLDERIRNVDDYTFSIKSSVNVDKNFRVVNASPWSIGSWQGIALVAVFNVFSIEVEYDTADLRQFLGARVEYFEAIKKENVTTPIGNQSETYTLGQSLGDVIMNSEQPLVQKYLLSPKKKESAYFYKVTWFLKSSSALQNNSNPIIETLPKLEINSSYQYLIAPKFK